MVLVRWINGILIGENFVWCKKLKGVLYFFFVDLLKKDIYNVYFFM